VLGAALAGPLALRGAPDAEGAKTRQQCKQIDDKKKRKLGTGDSYCAWRCFG